MHRLSNYVWHAVGKSRPFFCGQNSASPHFGKIWRTNFAVYRFKLAIGKVDGIKIKSAAGRQKNWRANTQLRNKWKFFRKLLRQFFRASTNGLLTHSRKGVEKVRPQLSELSLAIESAVFHIYQNTADPMVWLNSENCGRIFKSNTAEGDFFLSK